MKKSLFLVLVSLAVLNFNCATQQRYVWGEKCDAPVWNDGDSWKFIGGGQAWEEKIVGSTVRQTPKKGFYGFFNIPFIGRKIFPLWLGKKVEGVEQAKTIEGIYVTYFYSFKVVEVAELKVEAGTFKSFKIEFKIVAPNREEGAGYFYYSPETKSIIRFETKSQLLYQWEDYELSSYQVKPDRQPTLTEKRLTPKQVAPQQNKNMVAVIGTSANIRSGAGKEFATITTVKQGDKLTVLGEYGEWFHVRLESGQEGWIDRRFVK